MELRQYQKEDVEFLSKNTCTGNLSDPRTGKTPTAIMTMQKKNCTKVLIVCPASAVYNWAEEYMRWTNKPCIPLVGTPEEREYLLKDWTHGLVLSYNLLKTTKKSTGLVDTILKHKPDAVIIDEAHRIKNPDTAAAKAVFKLKKIKHRMILTGTIAHGKTQEVFSALHFLFPEVFRSQWKFLHEYFHSRTMYNGPKPYTIFEGFKPGMQSQLQVFMSNYFVQRKRKEVMPWLPDKEYQTIKLPPNKQQIKYLQELQSFFRTENLNTIGILDRLIRYRQICLHPKLVNLSGPSPKLEWIKEYLTDYPDKPIIIFSKFTSFLKLLSEEINAPLMIGSTPLKKRKELIDDFQNGNINILLLNIDVGKEAITLDRAETTIFCDKYPPIGDIQQAEDRFVATTEDRKEKDHLIIELMLKGTYDEAIYDMLQKRADETDVLNDFKKYLERN